MATSRKGTGRPAKGSGGTSGAAGRRATARDGPPPALLDDVAWQIIEQLQADGRRPYAAIGKVVGLSEAAVRQRVQRLVDSGMIRIVAVPDQRLLGHSRVAMVGLRATGDLVRTADRLAAVDGVHRVIVTTGSFDLLTEVSCRDDSHLLEILQRLRTVDGVAAAEAFVYLRSTPE